MQPAFGAAGDAAAASLQQPMLPWLLATIAAMAALLLYFRREDRAAVYHTLFLYAASMAGQWLGGASHAFDLPIAAAVLHECAVIAGGIAVIRLTGLFVFRLLLRAAAIEPPRILEDIVVMLGYVAWGMMRLRFAGLDLSQIVTTSALITAIVAFAMQDTLGNLLGGVALELDSSLDVGDWVRIDDVEGRVVDIRWRSTSIETRNWDTVVVPNSQLMRSRFTVHGRRKGARRQWRRWIWFNVDYTATPARVIEAVETAVRSAEIRDVAGDPPPQCLLMNFEHGYASYALRYWLTDFARDDPTDSEVRLHVLTALQRAGMRIAVPEYSIHTVKQSEKHLLEVRYRETDHRQQILKTIDLFGSLSEPELRTVAERLVFAPFARGDVVTRQGAIAHWLYILVHGSADVVVDEADGSRRNVAQLSAGTCFGEMGLLTGAPRRATIIAATDLECFRLDKASLEDILRSRPALAEDFSRMLGSRQMDLETKLRQLNDDAAARGSATDHLELLGRIRKFFALD